MFIFDQYSKKIHTEENYKIINNILGKHNERKTVKILIMNGSEITDIIFHYLLLYIF